MTAEEFTSRLPKLTNNPLPIKPPFLFNGMSARIFPLRANLDALQQVCNGYLNFVPREAGYFRAAAPYVFLMVLDYGQVAEAVARIGWFAQIEVFFSVPVEWYKLVNGKWVFHDWAVITPYIFVNDMFSVPLGRTVFGFSKVLAQVMTVDSPWVGNPLAPVTLARVETMVFPEAYAGARLETKVFLEVERAAPMSNFRVPLDPHSPIAPWTMASNFASAMGGFGRDAMWMAQALRIFPVNSLGSPALMQEMIARMMPAFAPGGTGLVQNSLNLKQFRRSDNPDHLCYQSLTNGQMVTTAFNGGGLLGEERILLGDLSGGHSIRLYEHSSLPIARTLGLEIHKSWTSDDVDVAEIKPVMPFWIDIDLSYGQGVNLAWRTHDGIWKDETGRPFDPEQKPTDDDDSPVFNSAVATAIEAIAGPFQFSGTTIRVLPLLANTKKLQKFVDDYLNDPLRDPHGMFHDDDAGIQEHIRLTVWTRPHEPLSSNSPPGDEFGYVYMAASSFAGVTSLTNNVGDWAKYELAFMIPVKLERLDVNGKWQTTGVGAVPAYTFIDDCIGTISRFEVQGIGATTANFVRPESVWLGVDAKFCREAKQTLLRVDAEVWPAYGAGQKSSMQPIVEISEGDDNAGVGAPDSRDTPGRWTETLRQELLAQKTIKAVQSPLLKTARALSLELLGNETPFALYTLKQFRDAADPDKACYQSLVRVLRSLGEVFDVCEIEKTLVVHIHDYPGLDIVTTLGIVAPKLPESTAGIVYSAQAIRPFYIRATVDEPLAQRLATRSGTREWTIYSRVAFATLLSDETYAPGITADALAETLQDQIDPSRMSANMYQARQRLNWTEDLRKRKNAPAIGKQAAREALAAVDPQTVIESILSREWGRQGENSRWRLGRAELLKAFSALPVGGPTKAFAESVFYRQINNAIATRPGAVASSVPLEGADTNLNIRFRDIFFTQTASRRWQNEITETIGSQQKFTEARLTMERGVDLLASFAVLGFNGLQKAFENSKPGTDKPSMEALFATGEDLMQSLETIANMTIAGEPSERNNLDTQVLADYSRFRELLTHLAGELEPYKGNSEAALEAARAHLEEYRQIVDLARRFCGVQLDALVNKLSRGYQKPDFCIRRDAAGPHGDRWLPGSLSWDDEWYYGRIMEYGEPNPTPDLERLGELLKDPKIYPQLLTFLRTNIAVPMILATNTAFREGLEKYPDLKGMMEFDPVLATLTSLLPHLGLPEAATGPVREKTL